MTRPIRPTAFLLALWLSGCASPDVMTSAKNAYQLGNYTKALKLWKFAAAKGDPKAITNVAGLYEDGKGVQKNLAEAVRWYRLGVDKGSEWAANDLGYLYTQGKGVPKDYTEALRLFRISADKGYPHRPVWQAAR